VAALFGRATAVSSGHAKALGIILAVILAAWALCAWAEVSGAAAQFHHHALYANPRALWLSGLMLVVAWQAMTAAMMLPSSLGFINMYAVAARNAPDFPSALGLFLASYFAVWTIFALAAFAGDMRLHTLVDSSPWLASHSQLILAGTLGFAAIYQMTPLKDACLKACRNPGMYLARHYQRGAWNGMRLGFGHALFCLGCCWALMLVMFAAGVAHLAWMGVLGVVMFVEKSTPAGRRIVIPVGIALALLAISAAFGLVTL
jgi:predicted metal-binding membrane protein